MLISAYPEGLLVPNADGQLPLHKAVDHEYPSLESIGTLLEACPAAAEAFDHEGYLPLHITLDCPNPDYLVAEKLLKFYPNGAKMSTGDGLLPMHIIMSSNDQPSVDFIDALLMAYPDSARVEVTEYYPTDGNTSPNGASGGDGSGGGIGDGGWQGAWKEQKWTALERATERGLDDIVVLMRSACIGTSSTRTRELVNHTSSSTLSTPVKLGTKSSAESLGSNSVASSSHTVVLPRMEVGSGMANNYNNGNSSSNSNNRRAIAGGAPIPMDPVPIGLKIATEKIHFSPANVTTTTTLIGGLNSGTGMPNSSRSRSARKFQGSFGRSSGQESARSELSESYGSISGNVSSGFVGYRKPRRLSAGGAGGGNNDKTVGGGSGPWQVNSIQGSGNGRNGNRSDIENKGSGSSGDVSNSKMYSNNSMHMPIQDSRKDAFVSENDDFIEEFSAVELGEGYTFLRRGSRSNANTSTSTSIGRTAGGGNGTSGTGSGIGGSSGQRRGSSGTDSNSTNSSSIAGIAQQNATSISYNNGATSTVPVINSNISVRRASGGVTGKAILPSAGTTTIAIPSNIVDESKGTTSISKENGGNTYNSMGFPGIFSKGKGTIVRPKQEELVRSNYDAGDIV
jgi:hypothetical protein